MKTKKKTWIKRGIFAAVIVAAAGAGVWASSQPKQYHCAETVAGDIVETVEADGTVVGFQDKTYYANISAPIETLSLKAGQETNTGDTAVTYDLAKLSVNTDLAVVQADEQINQGNAQLESNENLQDTVNTWAEQYNHASEMTDWFQLCVDDVKSQIADYEEQEQAIGDVELELEDLQMKMNFMEKESDREHYRQRAFEKGRELIGVKKKLNQIDIVKLRSDLTGVQEKLATWKAEKEKYALKIDHKLELMTPSGQAQISGQKKNASIVKQEALRTLEKAKAGIVIEENGIVSQVYAKEGEVVAEGSPLFQVTDVSKKFVEIFLSDFDVVKVKTGQVCDIVIGDRTFQGTVWEIYQIAEKADGSKAKVKARVNIQQPDKAVYLGLEAGVTIRTEQKENVILLPVEALYSDDVGSYCYTIAGGVITKKSVTVGLRNKDFVEITEGLSKGDIYVLDSMTDVLLGTKASGVL